MLDEPAAGLDPKARVEFKRLVRLLAGEGKTIFISSHILSELGEMCDTMLFIDNGRGGAPRLGREPATPAGRRRGVRHPGARCARPCSRSGSRLIRACGSWTTHRRGARVTFDSAEPEAIAAQLQAHAAWTACIVTDFHRESRKLEDAFVDHVEKNLSAGEFPRHPPCRSHDPA